jgi:hypothetical protein
VVTADVDIAGSPAIVDTFQANAFVPGGPPIAGAATWFWSAFNKDNSTTSYNTGFIQLCWNGARTMTLTVERDRAEAVPEVTFTTTVAVGPGASVIVTLLATVTINNYAISLWRMPYTTQPVTI